MKGYGYNDGIGESNVLQNQFTAYLITAIQRQKLQYLQVKFRSKKFEIPLDMQEDRKELLLEQDMLFHLPLLEQFENNNLRQALMQLRKRDLLILTRKVMDERTFQEIASETGVGYKTVASIYYRILHKLRDELGGER